MKKLLLALTALTIIGTANATHVVGGSIQTNWVSANNYTFTVTVYRDCHVGSSPMPTSLTVGVYQADTDLLVGSTFTISSPVITANLPFGDECYTPTDMCVDQGIFTSGIINLPNHAAGYYVSTAIYARNNIITNLDNPGSQGMTFYAEIPDPALGQNSSPQWGPYPLDAYLCIDNLKEFDFGVTDPDGDSLVYSLVSPLYAASSGTSAGPYADVTWNTPTYSLANICGGTPPMSINSNTGVVSASPDAAGVFVFAVRVEEYRGGVKIGETRNDVQYNALNCVFDQAPTLYVGEQDTLVAELGQQFCFDMVILDDDEGDTLALSIDAASTISEGAIFFLDTNNTYNYYNTSNSMWESIVTSGNTVYDTVNNWFIDTGSVGLRYCWQTECGDELVSAPYEVGLSAFSIGCSGHSDTMSVTVYLDVRPIEDGYEYTPNVFSPNNDGYNDIFKLAGIPDPCYDEIKVEIYNRWGQLVYDFEILPESGDLIEWDGKNKGGNYVAGGTYYLWIKGQYGGVEVEEHFPVTVVY